MKINYLLLSNTEIMKILFKENGTERDNEQKLKKKQNLYIKQKLYVKQNC